ncbi:DUF2793 domain-containing protein [Chelativorans alearense]|uniref:DUF2793 domain-containing protein n=1 Tax=Chelativorans alearense TaxID=2681495 RepID=UPI0013D7F19F|nr:DUF2793 domain-containing protein [Chelativorans alearense]
MADTTHLGLPLIAASQAQKHVTHNEALTILDQLVQLSVISRQLTAAPGAPDDGDRYIPAAGSTGAWAGWDFNVAVYTGGAWVKLVPRAGWRAFVADEADLVIYVGGAWAPLASTLGLIQLGPSTVVSQDAAGSRNSMVIEEELLSGLSGATVDSSIVIPNRGIVFGVSTRTVTAVTGATSYDCGIAGEPSKFGGSLSISAGGTNAGVIGPQAFYADTPIRLTANGGNFTGGAVRIAIHYFMPTVPQE